MFLFSQYLLCVNHSTTQQVLYIYILPLNLIAPLQTRYFSSSVLPVRKPKVREVKSFPRGHRASNWCSGIHLGSAWLLLASLSFPTDSCLIRDSLLFLSPSHTLKAGITLSPPHSRAVVFKYCRTLAWLGRLSRWVLFRFHFQISWFPWSAVCLDIWIFEGFLAIWMCAEVRIHFTANSLRFHVYMWTSWEFVTEDPDQ